MFLRKSSGFTLIELAVVVFLIGLLASVGLSALNAQLASSHISDSKKKQEIIKEALITYLGKNKRLPCPATNNNGLDGRILGSTPGRCTGFIGIIPYAELGLPRSTALDGWENFFSYAVSPQWTLTYGAAPVVDGKSTNIVAEAFNVGINGTYIINDRVPVTNALTVPPLSSGAAVFIVSHGKNGLGAFTSKGTNILAPVNTTDEFANVPPATWIAPAAFFKREYTDIDLPVVGAFDDIVSFLNSSDLTTPLTKDGAVKSAESQWLNQIDSINSSIIGYMMKAPCAPPTATLFATFLTSMGIPSDNTAGTTTTFSDPWGKIWTYNQNQIPNNHALSFSDAGLYLGNPLFSPYNNYAPPYIMAPPVPNPNNTVFTTPTQLRSQLFVVYPSLIATCP